jgi:uncharacterized protein involved in response to NO
MSSLWKLGFRPFFLLGALWASIHILVWISFQTGWINLSIQDPILWHAHEMIFGFASAIIAGFLLTSSQNWTGIRGVHGRKLKLLVTLWVLGRATSIVSGSFPLSFTIIDLCFYPMLALFLKPYLWQASQKRNKIFLVLFAVLFLVNLSVHLDSFHLTLPVSARSLLLLSLFTVIVMIGIIGGRVIPFFTQNAIPTTQSQRHPWIETLVIPSTALAGISVVFWEFTIITASLCFIAALIHFVRWLLWKPMVALKTPILFILYVGYAWVFLGFFLRGLASLTVLAPSLSTHALTAGAIGIMIYGMITRVALGHTGRPIRASRLIVTGYLLLILASIVRVFGPWMFPQFSLHAIECSGLLWSTSFFVYLIEYTPILCKPRLDGKEG